MVASQTRKIQSLSKLQQILKWQAQISDTPLGLTGIGTVESEKDNKLVEAEF